MIMFLSYSSAEAHVLKTDGSIIATLHIDPNDEPLANGTSTIDLTFVDREGKLDITKCDCSIRVEDSGKEIASETVQNNSKISVAHDGFSMPFIFPTKGVYTIDISGKPEDPDGFQQFTFSYDVRVDRDADEKITLLQKMLGLLRGHGLHIVLFGAAIIISIIVIIRDKA